MGNARRAAINDGATNPVGLETFADHLPESTIVDDTLPDT